MKHYVWILLLILMSCGTNGFKQDQWLERGMETIKPFRIQMQTALEASLLEGITQGLGVCRVTAPQIVENLSTDKLLVGRTSHRLRNPGNAPQPWLDDQLTRYETAVNPLPPQVMQLPGGNIGYVEPIYVKQICLTCHGENLRPELLERLASLYPEDNARGYSTGEFRGLFWAEFINGEYDERPEITILESIR